MTQLQEQAFAQVAGADAGGLELLDAMQYGLDFIQLDIQLGVEGFEHFFEAFFQVALGVDAVDQGDCNQAIGIGHWRQIELPE